MGSDLCDIITWYRLLCQLWVTTSRHPKDAVFTDYHNIPIYDADDELKVLLAFDTTNKNDEVLRPCIRTVFTRS